MTSQGVRTALDEVSGTGEFKRKDAAWRNWISREEGAKFPPEKDRYHLYVSYACPWAHRTLITRAVKGLEDVISVSVVHPTWQKTKPDDPDDNHTGWIFGVPDGKPLVNSIGLGGPIPAMMDDTHPDPILKASSIREVYEYAKDTDGKYSVPVLWDKKLNTIVSNESSDILRMFNTEFNEFSKNPNLDLYPKDMREAIDAANEWVYPGINNGVYRCGFAKSQAAYDQAIPVLTEALDKATDILGRQKYIAGNRFTEADIRLFVTLVRFDEVYTVYFKTNTRSIAQNSVLLNYCREIYQKPGVKETVNMEHIKTHYYTSHPDFNRWSVIPLGDNFEKKLAEGHNRWKIGTPLSFLPI